MKLCISNIAWNRQDNEQYYQLLQQHQIPYLELAPFIALENGIYATDEELKVFQDTLSHYQLTPVSIQSLLFGVPREMALFESDDKRQQLKQTLKEVIDFAAKIGAYNLVFGSPKNRYLFNPEDYHLGVALFKELGDYAHRQHVFLAMEPNAKAYGTNFATTLTETLEFIDAVNSPGVRLNFDLGSFLMENETETAFIQAIPYMNHVHISAPLLSPITSLDKTQVARYLQLLSQHQYTGVISIEMKQSEANNLSVVEESLQFLKELASHPQEF